MTRGSPSSSSSPGHAPLPVDVPEFLDLFLDRFAAGDVPGVCELWDLPALVLGDEQVHGLMSQPHLVRLFTDAVPRPSGGFSRARAAIGAERIESIEWLSERVVMVELPWPGGSAGGFLEGVEATTFALRIDQAQNLKIRALLLRGHGHASR
jgi:hypothetical protein